MVIDTVNDDAYDYEMAQEMELGRKYRSLVLALLGDLMDRRGIKNELNACKWEDPEMFEEIVQVHIAIVEKHFEIKKSKQK